MSDMNTLTEMGINNPQEIDRYHVHTSNNIDILRIVYKRKKGSLLPTSRRYRFPQVQKSVLINSGTRQTNVIYESADTLRRALDELDITVNKSGNTLSQKEILNDEIRRLEDDFASRISYIRTLIDNID